MRVFGVCLLFREECADDEREWKALCVLFLKCAMELRAGRINPVGLHLCAMELSWWQQYSVARYASCLWLWRALKA